MKKTIIEGIKNVLKKIISKDDTANEKGKFEK